MIEEIFDYINNLEIIDTHEHLPTEQFRIETRPDIFDIMHYVHCDFHSAGLRPEEQKKLTDQNISIEKRWKIIDPYWNQIKNTIYTKTYLLGLKDIHGFSDLNSKNYKEVNDAVINFPKKGCYKKVLKDMAKIKISINDNNEIDGDGKFFLKSFNTGGWILLKKNVIQNTIKQGSGDSSLKQLFSGIRKIIKDGVNNNFIVALKTATAYSRTLDFGDKPSLNTEELLSEFLSCSNPELQSFIELSNAIFHELCVIAEEFDLPFQIHTGIHAGGDNLLTNADPILLNPIFMRYRNVKFDIFHAGYPWGNIVGALSKEFANVFPDMAWVHIISRESAMNFLNEWIEILPMNKILGFGGDYHNIEGAYAHSIIARENIANVLTKKVKKGFLSIDSAKEYAEAMLVNNPAKLFKIK